MSISARPCHQGLRVDGGVNYEFSQLKVSGDANEDRTLKFLKPNLTLDWKPGGGWHTQFSVKRTVAQLDFYDFISVGRSFNPTGQRRQRRSPAPTHLGIPSNGRPPLC